MSVLSVIVPVYNAQRYLATCVDSILNQTFKDFELLLIDDGSKDNSGKVCDEYLQKDKRIKVFHKQNGGVSSARNLGIKNACTEWITFVDADDFLSPTFFDGLMKPTYKYADLDLVEGGGEIYEDGQIKGYYKKYSEYVGDDPDLLVEEFRGRPFSKLHRLKNIQQWSKNAPLLYDEKMIAQEDMAFTIDYMLTVKKYAFVTETGYYYRVHSASAMHNMKPDYNRRLLEFKHVYNSLQQYIKQHNLKDIALYRKQCLGSNVFGCFINCCITTKNVKQCVKHIKTDFTKEQLQLVKYYSFDGNPIRRFLAFMVSKGFYYLSCSLIIYAYKVKHLIKR